MSSIHESMAAEISCWGKWFQAVRTQRPGLYFVAGQTASGKNIVLKITRTLLASSGVRAVDSAGIVEIDAMLKGIVVVHGEVCDVAGMQRVVDLASVGAVVLCSMHARSVRSALWRIRSPMLGESLDVVGPHLRAVMAQILVPKMTQGRTCINELAVFRTALDIQKVLEIGVDHSLREDAGSKVASGIVSRASAERAGVLDR